MKKIIIFLQNKIKLLPYFIVVISLLFAGFISYTITPKSKIAGVSITKQNSIGNGLTLPAGRQEPFVTITPTISPTPTNILLAKQISITITQTTKPISPTLAQSNNSNQVTTQPTTIPTIPMISPTRTITSSPTPTQTMQTVSLQVQTPDGTTNTTVTLNDGSTVCDVLEEAKNEGKISSVTFDDTYMDSLHSAYVSEINGYKNNWTFTVNGKSPLGCSLSTPKSNDSIVWKFD